jgi:hypothetical protein
MLASCNTDAISRPDKSSACAAPLLLLLLLWSAAAPAAAVVACLSVAISHVLNPGMGDSVTKVLS